MPGKFTASVPVQTRGQEGCSLECFLEAKSEKERRACKQNLTSVSNFQAALAQMTVES